MSRRITRQSERTRILQEIADAQRKTNALKKALAKQDARVKAAKQALEIADELFGDAVADELTLLAELRTVPQAKKRSPPNPNATHSGSTKYVQPYSLDHFDNDETFGSIENPFLSD